MTHEEKAGQTGVPQEWGLRSSCPVEVSSGPDTSSLGSIDFSEETGGASVSNRISGGVVHGNVIQGGVVHIHPGPVRGDAVDGGRRLGKPIGEWDAHDLEVHPAGAVQEGAGRLDGRHVGVMPGYVRRAHDQELASVVRDVVEGRSRMVVLVGSSSTGKTRACWEAVQPLAEEGWRLWHPFDPTRVEAVLAGLDHVGPRTVVWLNEAQHYLGHLQDGERIAAAVHTLLTHPDRGPVLVLGTLWPEYANAYAALPRPGGPDPHSRVRELLTGRTVTVPDAFDREALHAATGLARNGDQLMADALTRAHTHGRLAQDLAGAPELLRRYEHGAPAVRALLEAAMDARRLGVGPHLLHAFLTDAATDYLTEHDCNELTEDWAEAFASLARPIHGKQAPLRRTTTRPPRRLPGVPAPAATPPLAGPVFRLADYLEQHGRTTRVRFCPPASFWHSAHTHLTDPDDLRNLAKAAGDRHRLQWAHYLMQRAADAGSAPALADLAKRRESAGDLESAEALLRQAVDAGDHDALADLARVRDAGGDREGAEALARQAANAGDPGILFYLALVRESNGDREGAEASYREAVDAGYHEALIRLSRMREAAGDREGAEVLARQAAKAGHPRALASLAQMRGAAGDRESAAALAWEVADAGHVGLLVPLTLTWEEVGEREGAEALARQAANAGSPDALAFLAMKREEAGEQESAEALARQAANAGHVGALVQLALMREANGDRESAEALAQQAANAGHPSHLVPLTLMREANGDRESAEALARQAADAGHVGALVQLALMREANGDRESAEALARQAAKAGNLGAELVLMREANGDREGAEAVARQAADAGRSDPLVRLALMREANGDRESAEALAREAADTGRPHFTPAVNRWPYGLDPDGSPTPPWS